MTAPVLPQELSTLPIMSTQQPATSNLGDILNRANLLSDLATVEEHLLQQSNAQTPVLTASGMYTIRAGGKRLRAVLVLLAARLGHYTLSRVLHPAAAVELLHGASLLHDDLVDNADRRRGNVTVHSRWDNHVALILGDFFFALSAAELAAEPDSRVIRFYATASRTLVEGELSPVNTLEPLEIALQQYHYKIGCKTAALFEAACKAGIAVAGGSDEQIELLGRFGFELGVAFQIIDDILDFVGDEAVLGKPAGNDLREGTWTLPLLYALETSTLPLLQDIIRTKHVEPADVPDVIEAVIAAGGVQRAFDDARASIDQAIRLLDAFPPSQARQALVELCEFVLARRV